MNLLRCLFLLVVLGGGGNVVLGQITLNPANPYYVPGQDTVTITSVTPIGLLAACDRIKLTNISNVNDTVSITGPDLVGVGTNTVTFLLPDTVTCDTFDLFFNTNGICGLGTVSNTVQIIAGDLVAFQAGTDTSYCVGENNPILSNLLTAGSNTNGLTFTSDAGFNLLNSSTGEVFLSNSTTTGSPHQVVVSTSSVCAVSDTIDISVQTKATLYTFAYQDTTYCPLLTGGVANVSPAPPTLPGIFTATPGLVFSGGGSTTGEVDLVNSTPGTYTVTYVPNPDLCFNTVSAIIQVDTVDSAQFSFQPNYCENIGLVAPAILALPPLDTPNVSRGSFSISSVPTAIDPETGVIDLDQLTFLGGPYTVTYQPTSYCADTNTATFNVLAAPDPTITLNDTFCQSDAPVTPVVNFPGGVFSQDSTFMDLNTNTGLITFTTSTPGGPYTLYYDVLDSSNGCRSEGTDTLFILGVTAANLAYLQDSFCSAAPNAIPNFSQGALGGAFTAAPGGLDIDVTTGVIDLANSTAGTYTVAYTQTVGNCVETVNVPGPSNLPTITISEYIQPDFTLPNPICQDDSLLPIASTAVNAGPDFFEYQIFIGGVPYVNGDAIVNQTDLNTDTIAPASTYELYLIVENGVCRDTAIEPMVVLDRPDPTFYYLDSTYCGAASDPIPFIAGDAGGIFTFTDTTGNNGLSLLANGVVQLDSSAAGNYFIQYAFTGACPDSSTFEIEILPANSAGFDYGAGTEFCTFTDSLGINKALTGGTFTVIANTPGDVLAINGNGDIFPGTSDPGIYQITHEVSSSAQCQETANLEIEIIEADQNTQLDYVDSVYCINDPNPRPTLVRDSLGAFQAPPGLIVIDTLGTINVGASNPGTYPIRYVISGRCPITLVDTVVIEDVQSSAFLYASNFFCNTDTNPLPAILETQGGTFFGEDNNQQPLNQLLDSLTGEIFMNLIPEPASPYSISYTPDPNLGCADTTTLDIIIGKGPDSISFEVEPLDSTICAGDEVRITAVGGSSFSFFRDDRNPQLIAFDSLDSPQSYVTNNITDTTTISVDISNSAGCITRREVTITVDPTPVINFTQTPRTISSNETAQLFAAGNVDDIIYNWLAFPLAGTVEFSPDSASVGPLPVTTQGEVSTVVTLSDTNSPAEIVFQIFPTTAAGCPGETIYDTIAVNPRGIDIFIPEIFTPNFDGVNDRWQIQWSQDIVIANWRVEVFNRAGAMVLDMNPARDDWDGDNLPDGVYWWKLIDRRDDTITETGGVTIIRKRLD